MTSIDRRPRAAVLATLIAGGLLLAGCSSGPNSVPNTEPGGPAGPSSAASGTSSPSSTPTPDPVTMTASVKNGAKGVDVDTMVKVSAKDGTLSKVTVSAPIKDRKTGKTSTDTIEGALNSAKTEWTASDRLEPGATYTVKSSGENKTGTSASATSTFATDDLSLKELTYATITPSSSGTYGIAMPVIINFDVPVKNKKEFQKHLDISISPKQTGTWAWISDNEVHFRPKEYWKAGTKVSVKTDIDSLDAGNGVYGQNDVSTSFTVGDAHKVDVDLKALRMQVISNGKVIKNFPVSGGKAGSETRSTTFPIQEKLRMTKMTSASINVPDHFSLDVPWAMRLTRSGEFVHANYWNTGAIGSYNSSHACVGLYVNDAKWLFDWANIGDPVSVHGTGRGMENDRTNGWTDWTLSYSQFAKGSAL